VTYQLYSLKLERAMNVDGVCQISGQLVCTFIRRRFLKLLASFLKKSKWRPNHVTNQLFGLKLASALYADGV